MEDFTMSDYTINVYIHILNFFANLKHFSIIDATIHGYPSMSLCNFPSIIFDSSILTKLCINVYNFDDCLCLLDGRLKQLNTFIVEIDDIGNHSSIVCNMVSSHFIFETFFKDHVLIDHA